MEMYLFFLGSNPTLSAVECWTTLQREKLAPCIKAANDRFILFNLARELPAGWLKRLGGTDRIAAVAGRQDHLWEVEELAGKLSPTAKKFSLGISTLNMGDEYAKSVGLKIKKLFKAKDVRVRFILPQGKSSRLNAAQVIFNQLTSLPNRELTIIKCDEEYLLAETIQVQDIQAYERRDTRRPVRDARVGMLPPKLAQIMLNLVPEFADSPPVILDPFCGVGTVVQEGCLMGYKMIGSDVSERMVKATEKNLRWVMSIGASGTEFLPRLSLAPRHSLPTGRQARGGRPHLLGKNYPQRRLFVHDVRDSFPDDLTDKVDAVVTEPDLGEPLSAPLPRAEMAARWRQSAKLYKDFFINVRPVLKDGGGVIMALPAFRQGLTKNSGFNLFPLSFLDEVGELGYCWSQLLPYELKQYYEASERGSIIYARPDALVGRELTLWHIKKPGAQHN